MSLKFFIVGFSSLKNFFSWVFCGSKILLWVSVGPEYFLVGTSWVHSHTKRKDNLKVGLVRVLFAAELDLPKILVPRLPQHTPIENIDSTRKSKQLYYLRDQLLRALIYIRFIPLILV